MVFQALNLSGRHFEKQKCSNSDQKRTEEVFQVYYKNQLGPDGFVSIRKSLKGSEMDQSG